MTAVASRGVPIYGEITLQLCHASRDFCLDEGQADSFAAFEAQMHPRISRTALSAENITCIL
jgi:hypothetical protein